MNLMVEIKCKLCGFILRSDDLTPPDGSHKVEGTFTLTMRPPHTCSGRYALLQTNDLKVRMTSPLPDDSVKR